MISLVLNDGRSQSGRARRGTCGRGQPYRSGAPSHLGGVLTACLVCVDVEAEGKAEVLHLQYKRESGASLHEVSGLG